MKAGGCRLISTLIKSVEEGSIAKEAGIEAGDCILSINGEKITDIFDYRFYITNEELVLKVQKKNGDIWEIEIEKDEYEDLGIEFEDPMLDEARSCRNKCIFCFIDQLPKGLRKTLYFKDDDSRLSFLMGNYITMTNMQEEDINRIIKYRMSPVNVSVHTTNPDLRVFMLKNKFAGNIKENIKKLVDAGILVNCQIVLCRGINDGEELDRTIRELTDMSPGVNSISVVPVGITKYREKLTPLTPYDKNSSLEVIEQVEKWQKKLLEKYNSRIVYLADEFYIMASKQLPPYEAYEDFPQIENGVGMMTEFMHEFEEYLQTLKVSKYTMKNPRKISIATGVLAYGYIKAMVGKLESEYPELKADVFAIKNNFFGENVTVTGLITGGDIVAQLKGKDLGEELLISQSMLKSGEEIFLDDYTVEMVEKELGVAVKAVKNNGKDFIEAILIKE